MAFPQSIAYAPIEVRFWLRHAPERWLNHWLRKGACLRAISSTRSEADGDAIAEAFHALPSPAPLLRRVTCGTPSFPDHPLTTTDERVVGKLRGAQRKGVGGGGVKREVGEPKKRETAGG
jgi:hypothetical protein